MAYSDYGGYAYRNGARVEERSDFTITPDGGFGTPGSYPGFAMIAAGATKEQVLKTMDNPRGHAVLGDGPVFVTLYKQTTTDIYRGMEKLDLTTIAKQVEPGDIRTTEWNGAPYSYLDHDEMIKGSRAAIFEVDGCIIEVRYTHEDNYYQYVKLTQPDGTVWHGWSGYGVGAGLEDCGYGFDTGERESTLTDFWPEAITKQAA